MRLPEELREAIAAEIGGDSVSISKASAALSQAYRREDFKQPPIATAAHRIAYLNARLPATFAACRAVFSALRESIPGFAPESLLDLGAGPGTATWAAVEAFPSIRQATLLERDRQMLAIGQRMAALSSCAALRDATWRADSIESASQSGSFDLVIASYVLCEIDTAKANMALQVAWQRAGQVLCVVEPGTPSSFSRVVKMRDALIASGATIAAPCPHELECPLFAAGDWCHFSARLERSSEHRRLKGGSLGYEDEKFSYLCATRLPDTRPETRIVRHPMKYSGHVKLELCTESGIRQETVTRSQKTSYRQARRTEWGDGWPVR